MRTVHLLPATLTVLAGLALAPWVPVVSPVLCLTVVFAAGEFAVRVLVREPLSPAAHLGLVVVAGLISLPSLALILNTLSVRIEGRWLIAALTVLVLVLGALSWRRPRGRRAVSSDAALSDPCVDRVHPCPHPAHRRPDPPHPRHWVGRVKQRGTTSSAERSTGRGPAASELDASERSSPRWATPLAIALPTAAAILVGATATVVYQRLPHPPEQGYTSLALAGWAADLAHPIRIPAGGLDVPVDISRQGEPDTELHLLVKVGNRVVGPGVPARLGPNQVHVPAPADGCLHPIRISIGPTSTVFYGRGPGATGIRTRTGVIPC